MRSSITARRRTIAIALGLATAALSTPAAYANFDQYTAPASSTAKVWPALVRALPPEDQAALRGGPAIGGYAVALTGRPRAASGSLHVDSPHSETGFNWGDAGVGAGTAVGALLLGAGGAAVTRRARRPLPAAD